MTLKRGYIYINCYLKTIQRGFHTSKTQFVKYEVDYKSLEDKSLYSLIKKHENKIIYNSFVIDHTPKIKYRNNNVLLKKLEFETKKQTLKLQTEEPLPLVLKYLGKNELSEDLSETFKEEESAQRTHFPFNTEGTTSVSSKHVSEILAEDEVNLAESIEKEVKERQSLMNRKNWMTDYENYEESIDENDEDANSWKINYGTPDPNVPISQIPCGGCGALLHCQDSAIPGYIPSEIYKNSVKREGTHLKALICQRCHFLKYYDLALQVRVTAEDYPKVLETIKEKRGLILLVIDLLNYPCSIWPGIANILGTNKSLIIIGNKVDLLPRDTRGYLDRIKQTFADSVFKAIGKQTSAKVKHVALISAKTGWGIEELITKLQNLRRTRGDVFIVGCTNVGKSSLFNSLLQSDYCKIQAVDLIQRATTSVWPGTTLNLLKFPILRPSGWSLMVRTKRLQYVSKLKAAENKLNKIQLQHTKDIKYATLMGHIDRTFTHEPSEENGNDPFSIQSNANSTGKIKLGINENDPLYATGKWCYDTPGVIQPDQIIHLLTTEELMLTLPRELIRPKTFTIRPNQTLFIAGMGRLDYTEGPYSIRVTVFCAKSLPLTICSTEDADLLYEEFLGTDLFLVPRGSPERMSKWPGLKSNNILKLNQIERNTSCGDIVLSDAGWIAITSDPGSELVFKAWTPEGRGIYVRQSLLPGAVGLKGKKIRHTPAYSSNRLFVPQ